jgi:mannose-6-phosphate isomerase-like protein (cupin superfamily)
VNEVTSLEEAFAAVDELWSPRVVAQANDQYVKVARVHGTFTWHDHAEEDELFYVVRGRLRIEYEGGRSVELGPGDLHVVPRGTLHCPVADEEVWLVLVEPVATKHTGDVVSPLTRSVEQQLNA